MLTADFDYHLPRELIAQSPSPRRDGSKLLVLNRAQGSHEHRRFQDLPQFLRPGDVLVLNDSKAIPARLRGRNAKTSGAFELLLLGENAPNDWWAMVKPGKRARLGTQIQLRNHEQQDAAFLGTVIAANPEGHRRLQFAGPGNLLDALAELGEIPLPPYIERHGPAEMREDQERYQTIFASAAGSVAAPTAGLHFTKETLAALRTLGVEVHFVTLHVGLGTFAPVKAATLAAHVMHEERYEVSEATAGAINRAKAAHRRVVAVGTTSVRVLESVAGANEGRLIPGRGQTRIFIHPPRQFQIVDALLTNFHLPCSTLLMLVSAFATPGETRGRELILSAYAEAIRERYRFFSYGDAMLIL